MRVVRNRAGSSRQGFTILELLVTSGIVALLAGLVLPAVAAARETARKLDCRSRLRQVGIALANYADVNNGLPPGWQFDSQNRSAFAWGWALAPFLDEEAVASQIDPSTGLELELNNDQGPLQILLCPSDVGPDRFTLYADEGPPPSPDLPIVILPRANYVGVFGITNPDESPGWLGAGAFLQQRSIPWQEFTRGASNVALVGERTARRLPASWLGFDARGEDTRGRVVGFASLGPNRDDSDECDFDSRHPGGVHFLMGDGRVEFIKDSIDFGAYQNLMQRGESGGF
jgi:prepilin-type N-terminal cleavage/methylation domain-containing protein/prepilin-type processing-associated H-X9-DG protein